MKTKDEMKVAPIDDLVEQRSGGGAATRVKSRSKGEKMGEQHRSVPKLYSCNPRA